MKLEEELIWLRVQNATLARQMRMAEEDYTRSDRELDERLECLKKEKIMEEYLTAVFELEVEIQCALAEYSATKDIKYLYAANNYDNSLAEERRAQYSN